MHCTFFGRGKDATIQENQTYHTDSMAAKEILHRGYNINRMVPKNGLLILIGVQWSDTFELNPSIKATRVAVWIKTLTFV